jgi:hypothetical protein
VAGRSGTDFGAAAGSTETGAAGSNLTGRGGGAVDSELNESCPDELVAMYQSELVPTEAAGLAELSSDTCCRTALRSKAAVLTGFICDWRCLYIIHSSTSRARNTIASWTSVSSSAD